MDNKVYPYKVYVGHMQDGNLGIVSDEYAKEYVLKETLFIEKSPYIIAYMFATISGVVIGLILGSLFL